MSNLSEYFIATILSTYQYTCEGIYVLEIVFVIKTYISKSENEIQKITYKIDGAFFLSKLSIIIHKQANHCNKAIECVRLTSLSSLLPGILMEIKVPADLRHRRKAK